ncbi:hypothetical protein TNCV_2894661 [Trichonephila clavipes]|nr:hypothetical protein TNCV_2894661 [Trichonephila clavipes]
MSSFLGFCKWNTRNRWRDGQVCPDVDKELWRLGPDGSGDERDPEKRKREEVTRKERSRKRARKRRGLVFFFRKRRGESQSFDPCFCPRVKNADEKQRLADWTETSCGESGFKTGIPYRL